MHQKGSRLGHFFELSGATDDLTLSDELSARRRRWPLPAVLNSIGDHYDALLENGMLFSDLDLVHHLQNFNLSACIEFGDYGSETWWEETLEPALMFFRWLICLQTVSPDILFLIQF